MSYELKMKLLMHLVCIVQWGVFALIHWEMLGKGKWKHPFACTALAMCGMLVISLWIDFGFFNAASIAFNVLYLLVTSAFFGGTIRQKLMSCMANGVVCLLTENTVIYLYTYLEAVPPAQVIRQPLGVLLMVAAMLIVGGITAQMAKHWGQKQALEPLQLVVAMFFPGVVVVLNMLLMVSGGRFDATQFSVLFTVGLTVAVLVHLLFVQMLNEQVVQKKDSQYRATLEQERAEALMESYTTQRRLTHEFANHLEALSLMLQQNDVAGARGYLTSISKTIQMNSAILNTHNPLLDALLSKKYEEAARKGVMMYFDLSDLKDIPLDRTHLVTIIDKSTKGIGTAEINPSDFPFDFYLFICCPDDRYQCVHHLPLVLKADILPVIQIPGNAFHLLHRHSVRREFCNLIGNGLPPCVQFLNFAVGIGEQNRACARQRVKQLFNLAFHLRQFQPLCRQLRGDFRRFFPACQRLKIFQLLHHSPIDHRFQFVQLYTAAAGAGPAVRMDGAAHIKNTVRVRRHERIAAFSAFDFPRHPCIPGFPCRLVSMAGK